MLEAPIRRRNLGLTILFCTLAAAFSSCATEKKNTALFNDASAQNESSIPWNKPAKWESGANIPGGIGGGPGGTIGN